MPILIDQAGVLVLVVLLPALRVMELLQRDAGHRAIGITLSGDRGQLQPELCTLVGKIPNNGVAIVHRVVCLSTS